MPSAAPALSSPVPASASASAPAPAPTATIDPRLLIPTLGPSFPTKQNCAFVCHAGIEKQKIGVAGTRFDHATHVTKSGRDCDACHSAAEHGKMLPAAKDCVACPLG